MKRNPLRSDKGAAGRRGEDKKDPSPTSKLEKKNLVKKISRPRSPKTVTDLSSENDALSSKQPQAKMNITPIQLQQVLPVVNENTG